MADQKQNGDFYIVGGTMRSETPSYIPRPADEELLALTQKGQFSYILASRQMGKSSLMIRTGQQLRKRGILTTIIDLSEIGTHDFSAREWYLSLMYELQYQLALDIDLEEWWCDHSTLTPARSFTAFLREIVLAKISEPIVIFIDEIDTTLKLDFTDDFFSAIRALYNARTDEAVLNRLTFVFLGVVTPSALIKDPERTPFNIGYRVNLTDLTLADAQPLADGLGLTPDHALEVLSWIFDWTGGHPYLTQRLCLAVSEGSRSRWSRAEVDRLVQETFFKGRLDQDDNLRFVAKMLTDTSPNLGKELGIYRSVYLKLFAVPNDDSPLISHLKLSGLVRVQKDHLQVRNQIYKKAFDLEWIQDVEDRFNVGDPREAARLKQLAKTNRLLRISLLGVGILFLIASIFAWLMFVEQGRAERFAQLALARQLAAQVPNILDEPDLALLLAVQANEITTTKEIRDSLFTAIEANPHLITILHNHSDEVRSVVFSPDGKTLASGSYDGTIILWDVATGQPIGKPLIGHTEYVVSLAFSPDGHILASGGSSDLVIRLWDVATGQPIGEPLVGHESWVHSVAFSPDGSVLASGSGDHTIRLWDVETHQPIGKPIIGHNNEVNSVVFSPDGKILAAADRDNQIILWDIATRQPLGLPLVGHDDWVWQVVFSPDGKFLASASYDKTIILWDIVSGEAFGQPLVGHEGIVTSVAFSPDGTQFASSGGDQAIRLWDVSTGQPIGKPLTGHTSTVWGLAFSPDGYTLASASEDQTIILWDLMARQGVGHRLVGHKDGVSSVAISPDGQMIASASWDHSIRLWEAETGNPQGEPLIGHTDGVESVVFSPDGQILASGGKDQIIIVWDLLTRQPMYRPLVGHNGVVESVAFSPDGQVLASASTDATIILWDIISGQPRGEPLRAHDIGVEHVVFSPDGTTLASAGSDNLIRLWDVKSGQPLGQPLAGHESWVHDVAFSPDGKTLASASADNKILLWNLEQDEIIGEPFIGHNTEVNSVAFSPDGKWLLSGDRDNKILLWDVTKSQPIAQFTGHDGWVWSVAFSPDGQSFASGGGDRKVILWNADFASWRDLACRKANRNLTQVEWDRFIGSTLSYQEIC